MAAYDVGSIDIPKLMQAAGEARVRRLQEMYLKGKIEKDEREADREGKLLGIFGKLRQPQAQDPSSNEGVARALGLGAPSQTPPAVEGAFPSSTAATRPKLPLSSTPGAGAAQSWANANKDVVGELISIAPDKAFELSTGLSKMDEAQLKRTQEMNDLRGRVAMHLKSYRTPAERRAELTRMMPQLMNMGITQDIVQQELGNLSDHDLQAPINLSMDVKALLDRNDKDRNFDLRRQDTNADNARADRNADSLIGDRTARRGLTLRGQNLTDARGRRGQDLASGDRHRGQDMTDRRVRETGGRRGKPGSSIVQVQTPEQARKLAPGTVFRTPDGRVKVR